VNREFCLDFSRAFGSSLGSGVIRHTPADFRVTEILGFEPSGSGEHVYLYVRKIDANTGWVAEQLARFLNIRHFDVGYAGRKDRHAETEQWFSCWLPGNREPDWSNLQIEGIEILKIVRHDKKLRRGDHLGNRFKLRISELRVSVDESILITRLNQLKKNGFPNYFGEQRFGRGGGNLQKANELLNGAKLGRRQRNLYISAARSYLFNWALSKKVDNGQWTGCKYAWLYGLAPHRDIEVPAVDVDFQDWGQGLERLGVKAMRRSLAVLPEEFDWQFSTDQSQLVLAFSLPSGAYATCLLRELIDYEEVRIE